MARFRSAPQFWFIGGHRCVDFVNTEVDVEKKLRRDLLTDFEAWLTWLVEAGVIDRATAQSLGVHWADTPSSERALADMREFRRVLRQTLERIVQGKSVPRAVVEAINQRLQARTGYVEIAKVRGGYTKRVHAQFAAPPDLLVPVAEAASNLLCDANFSLLRRCENDQCILFFYDRTKNRSRRWCSMQWCGNRMKVAAFRQRRREGK